MRRARNRPQALFGLVAWVALSGLCTPPSLAAVTLEQLKADVARSGVPYWRRGAAQVSTARTQARDPYYSNAWNALDEEAKTTPVPVLLGKLMSSVDPRELNAHMFWLRWRILTSNADGRYSYAYAYNLSRTRNAQGFLIEEAVIFFLHGRLSLRIDAARCSDRSSYQAAADRIEDQSQMRMVAGHLQTLRPAKISEALVHAVSIEELRGERPAQDWICRLGGEALSRALQESRNVAIGESNPSLPAAGQVIVDTSKVSVPLVSDERWRELRRQLLDRTLQDAADRANKGAN